MFILVHCIPSFIFVVIFPFIILFQKRRSDRRQTMIVRMAQKKITAARRMELIRRRSSVMREGGLLPSSRNVTSEEEGQGMSTVREASGIAGDSNNSSRFSVHRLMLPVRLKVLFDPSDSKIVFYLIIPLFFSRQNSAGNLSLPALSNSSLGRYRLASSTPNEPDRPRSVSRAIAATSGDLNTSRPIDSHLTPKRSRPVHHVRTPQTAPPKMAETPGRRTKRQRSGNEESDEENRKRRNLQVKLQKSVDILERG